MALQQPAAATVLGVVRVVGRVQRTGVRYQRAASSDRSISSIRRETSLLPLCPGAPRWRRPDGPTRWVEMASRVSSDTVIPSRSASWRRRCGGAKVNLQGLVGLLPSYCRLGRSATSSHVRLRFKPGLASGARRRMPPISPFA